MSVFGKYSQYYDLLYKDKDYNAEVEYIAKLIDLHSPQSKTILDLGSGTGIHDFLLAKKGFKVTGVDISGNMIAEANSKLISDYSSQKDSLNFNVGDIRTWESEEKFDVVVSLFHVMSYQVSNEDVKKALSTVKKHLKPNGLFIFDFWYGSGVLNDPPAIRVKRLENAYNLVTRLAEPKMYPNENAVDVNYTILVRDKSDDTIEEFRETHKMRYFFFPELREFTNNLEAKSISLYEWLGLNEPKIDSWTACMVIKV